MKWTYTKPEMPGTYWYRSGEQSSAIYRLDFNGDKGLAAKERSVIEMDGEWYGPLSPPEDK